MREALAAYIGVQVAAVAVALLAAHGFSLFIPEDVGPLVVEAAMLAALYAIHRRERLSPGDLGVRKAAPGRATGLVLLALLCLGFCEELWRRLVHESLGHSLFGGLSGQPAAAVALAGIAACAGAPIVEELFFRGLIYRSLRNRLPLAPATLIAAVLFAAPHLQYTLAGRVDVLLFGIAACLLYEATGSLLPGIALHSFVDSAAFEAHLTGSGRIVLYSFATLGALLALAALAGTIDRRFRAGPLAAEGTRDAG